MAHNSAPTPEVTLERVNTPPAQTWNYLRTNDVTLTVPALSRKGDVYFALPRLFESIECGMGEQVTSWVASQAADARYVEVHAGEKREEPIVVDVSAGNVADTGIMVRSGAEATVVVCATQATVPPLSADSDGPRLAAELADDNNGAVARSQSSSVTTSAALLRIIVERDARLHLLEFVTADDGQQHLESVGITADEGARVDVRQFFLGAQTTAAGLSCSLDGADARFDLTCRYLGKDDERLDINHVVRMRGKRGRANVSESGVLDGRARKALRATIDLIHGSSGSEGAELESVLVLSDDVTNKTMPVILCDEDDVAGNHGATIGSVGQDQIHYLADRGLSEPEAEALYVRALFDEALIAAPIPAVRAAVLCRAAAVLGSEIANDLVEGLGLESTDSEED